ncbi:MAG: hypothetical protein LC118_00540 [Dehalococcoidia bacterium]|nr:hypothetical protein [Dehalococcoidia bacterium]
MEGTIESFLDTIAVAKSTRFPVVTAYLDLSLHSDGTPGPAEAIARQGLAMAMEGQPPAAGEEARSLAQDVTQLQAAIIETRAQGARGVAYLGCAGEGFQHVLATPLPFRNDVRVGSKGWTFEVERYRYLHERPVTLVIVDLHTADFFRVRYGTIEATGQVDYDAHWLTKRRGRTDIQGRGGAPDAGFGGMHSKSRLEQIVEEQQAIFAREAAGEIAAFIGNGDLFFIAGVDEARANILNALPGAIRERAHLLPAMSARQDERILSTFALEQATAVQRQEADELVARVLSGAYGSYFFTGLRPVTRMFGRGRVDQLVLHEDAVSHWGTASDARHIQSPVGDDDAIEALIEEAERTGATVRFSRDELLLNEHRGVLATLRW